MATSSTGYGMLSFPDTRRWKPEEKSGNAIKWIYQNCRVKLLNNKKPDEPNILNHCALLLFCFF